jgi:hypothetical protein
VNLTIGDLNRQARVVILDAWNGAGLKEANSPVVFGRAEALKNRDRTAND